LKQDSSPKLPAGRHFWLSVLVISLGILGIGELLLRRDTLTLLYDIPSPHLIVVGLVGIALVGGCLFLIWLYPRVRTTRLRLAPAVTFFTSLCLVGSIILLSNSLFILTQLDYEESETIGLSTYRMNVDILGELSDIHQVDVVLYHCDALGVICGPACRQRTVSENASQGHLAFDSATGRIEVRFENTLILSC
jgi:hypothetical protein